MTNVGFSVPGILEQSAKATGLADELSSVRQKWLAATADPVSALGLIELVNAFGSMRQAWSEQYDLFIGVVSELSQSLTATASTYDRAELSNAEHVVLAGR
jgi:hypothetical protein